MTQHRAAFALYLVVAAIQLLVLVLFLLNLNVILATTTSVYHGPTADLNSFLGGLKFGVSGTHFLLGVLFLLAAFKIQSGERWARIVATILSVLLILGAGLFGISGYLKIFPPSFLPYVLSIMAIESVLALAAVIASWV